MASDSAASPSSLPISARKPWSGWLRVRAKAPLPEASTSIAPRYQDWHGDEGVGLCSAGVSCRRRGSAAPSADRLSCADDHVSQPFSGLFLPSGIEAGGTARRTNAATGSAKCCLVVHLLDEALQVL